MASDEVKEKLEGPEKKPEEKQPEEPKKVVLRGLPPGGVTVASDDGYGSKRFSARELEEAMRCGMAL